MNYTWNYDIQIPPMHFLKKNKKDTRDRWAYVYLWKYLEITLDALFVTDTFPYKKTTIVKIINRWAPVFLILFRIVVWSWMSYRASVLYDENIDENSNKNTYLMIRFFLITSMIKIQAKIICIFRSSHILRYASVIWFDWYYCIELLSFRRFSFFFLMNEVQISLISSKWKSFILLFSLSLLTLLRPTQIDSIPFYRIAPGFDTFIRSLTRKFNM